MSMTDPTHNEQEHTNYLLDNDFNGEMVLWFKTPKGTTWDYTVAYTTSPTLGIPPGLCMCEEVKGGPNNAYVRPLRFGIRHITSGRRVINAALKPDDAKLVLSKLSPLVDWDVSHKELKNLYTDPDCTLWRNIQNLETELGWSFPCLR
jgi:hypothetical protein